MERLTVASLLTIIVGLVALAGCGRGGGNDTASSGRASTSTRTASSHPQPAVFAFPNTTDAVTPQTTLVVRPSTFVMFKDGQWVIEGLRWTRWGSSVARAAGVSDASNDDPSAAQSKRIRVPAQVTLSTPAPFHGRVVYRCLQLTVPSALKSDQNLCLRRVQGGYLFE